MKIIKFSKAPKIRDYIRLNSVESFLVTLTSISSKTWEIHSWTIFGSSVFRDWLFFVFSGISLETAANFLKLLKVDVILRKKFCQLWRLNWSFTFHNRSVDLLLLWGKSFNEDKTVNGFNKWVQYQKATNLYNNNSTFISPIYTFSLAGNIIVYKTNQGTNKENYFIYNIYKWKNDDSGGK